jgi:thymidylate synthase
LVKEFNRFIPKYKMENISLSVHDSKHITNNNDNDNNNKLFELCNEPISKTIFDQIRKYSHQEYQYLHLLNKIIETGIWKEGRNGKVKSLFGETMRFSLTNGTIPILTTKKMAWKTCLKELLWFIQGNTNTTDLQKQGVHIWDANSSREFLDSRGLLLTTTGLIGPSYGYQWRYFNAMYDNCTGKRLMDKFTLETNEINQNNKNPHVYGVDQLQSIIDILKDETKRDSRRLIMTAWNPCQLNNMALPPCHILCQFYVHDGNKLSCSMYQRSCDMFLGSCFNIASYSFLTHLLAKHCGLEAHEFIYFMGDCHIYENAIEASMSQMTKEPFAFPTLTITQLRENINDYTIDDFQVNNYFSHEKITVDMVP